MTTVPQEDKRNHRLPAIDYTHALPGRACSCSIYCQYMNTTDELTRLRTYIASKKAEGVPEDDVRAELLRLGVWPEEMISEAFAGAPGEGAEDTSLEDTYTSTPYTNEGGVAEGGDVQSFEGITGTGVAPEHQGVMAGMADGGADVSQKPVRAHKYVLMTIGVFALLVVSGAFALSYSMLKPTVLSGGLYTEEDFLKGMAIGFSKIKTASYGFSGSLAMEPRDSDARPFSVRETEEYRTYREKYARDHERINALREISYELQRDRDLWLRVMSSESEPLSPETLPSLGARDPLSGQPYFVESRDDGTGFLLTITFETSDAQEAVSRSSFVPPSQDTVTDGFPVSFTADNIFSYYYLRSEPPQPFLVQLSESARFLPPDLDVSVALKVTSEETRNGTNVDMALDLEADFGDMMYKIAVDFRQVDNDYYVRVRNMPGFFLPMLGLQRGVWVHISEAALAEIADEYGTVPVSMLGVQEIEEAQEEFVREAIEIIQALIRIADEERVIAFRRPPSLETVDGRDVYKYDLTIRKESILPFMRRLSSVAEEQETLGQLFSEKDTLLQYLESESFSEVFEYLNDNISLLAYTTKRGEPARIELSMRLVPPDTARQLAGRQGRIRLTFDITDINTTKRIQVPAESMPIQQLMEDAQKNLEYGKNTPVLGEAIDMTANALSAWMSAAGER